MTHRTIGEQIGYSISKRQDLKNNPAELADFLVEHHGLIGRDAVQIALRLANEPEWSKFPPIRQLELILTQNCNLKCDYCFVDEQSEKIMSMESGKETIDFLLNMSGNMESVNVSFFGGEPLLAFRLIKDLVLYGENAARKMNKKIRWRMTTNGTLLNEESIAFFHDHHVVYLLSIDGDKNTQDAHRLTRTSRSSYEMLENKFALMKKYQPWMGARVTVMPDTVFSLLDNVIFLVGKGINQFIVEPAEGVDWPENGEESYIKQMTKVASFYLENKDKLNLRIEFFNQLMGDHTNSKEYTRGCWAGKSSVSIAPDGKIYPCSKFIDPSSLYPSFVLGDVSTGITDMEKRNQMIQFPFKKGCYECNVVFDCSGGCPANNYLATGDQSLTSLDECKRAKMKGGMQRAVMEILNIVTEDSRA